MGGSDVHDMSYYGKCMVGGILSCGLTHMAMCPIDIVKCRKQVDPTLYKSMSDGFKTIYRTQGIKGLTIGWHATLFGYSAQGFGKFGFYEIFKDVYKKALGPSAEKYQTIGFLASSACAEVIADTMLAPFEAVKVRMQTSNFTPKFFEGFNTILANEGWNGLYKGLGPLWMRQVPYTMVKFGAFENIVRAFYRNFFTAPKDSYSKATQLSIVFASGYLAGILCAIISHPADTMVSILNKKSSNAPIGEQVSQIYSEIGFKGLWNGIGARIIMVGTLTGMQWYIYDSFKVATGLQASGGK